MRWIRPLSLTLAIFVMVPGLSRAQAFWTPLGLPILFGQEAPPQISQSSVPEEVDVEEFGVEVGSGSVGHAPTQGSSQWTPNMPREVRQCQNLGELMQATLSVFNRSNSPTTTFAVFQAPLPLECVEEEAASPVTIVRECLTSSPCPVALRPYVAVSKVVMHFWKPASRSACGNAEAGHCSKNEVCTQPPSGVNVGSHCDEPCTQQRQARPFVVGPVEVEICWDGKHGTAVRATPCGIAQAACKRAGGSGSPVCNVKACPVSCAPVCNAVCAEACVAVATGKCQCAPAAGKACCPEGKCACIEKAVAKRCGCGEKAVAKKCGCGKECACCECKKSVHVQQRIERALRQMEALRRTHAQEWPVPGSMPLPQPGMAMPPLPVTFTLPPPPPMAADPEGVLIMTPDGATFHAPPGMPGHPLPPPPVAYPSANFYPVMPPACFERHVATTRETSASAVKLQTPLFEAQCDRLSCGASPDEVVLEGNVKVMLKRTPAQVSAARVVINTRTGAIRAEKRASATIPVSRPVTSEATLPSDPNGRMQQMLNMSEGLRQIQGEFERFWYPAAGYEHLPMPAHAPVRPASGTAQSR